MRRRLLEYDLSLTSRFGIAERPGLLRNLAAILAHSGDSWFWLIGLALVWWWGTDTWKVRALALAAGLVLTAVLVLLIKFSVRRQRPAGEWGGIYRKSDPHSFPSGHAARAAALTVMAFSLGPPWFGWALAVWAPLVGLARVAMGVHYLSDVLAGMVVGTVLGIGMIILF